MHAWVHAHKHVFFLGFEGCVMLRQLMKTALNVDLVKYLKENNSAAKYFHLC